MSDNDLFGSDNDGDMDVVARHSPAAPTSAGNDDDENLFGSDDEGETGWVDAPKTEEEKLAAILGTEGKGPADVSTASELRKITKSKLYLERTVPMPSDVSKVVYVKAPQFMKVQSNEYDKDTFDAAMERAEYGPMTSDVVRWRFKKDDAGNKVLDSSGKPVMESNTRLQKLKNGSYQIVIGKNTFDVSTEKMSKSYLFMSNVSTPPPEGTGLTEEEEASGVTINESTNLTMAGTLDGAVRMIIQPRLDSQSHAHVNLAINKKFKKQDRISVRDVRDILENPDVTLEKNEKEEKVRLLNERKGRDPDRVGGGGGSRSYRDGRIGMSSDYLNEVDQYDEINLSEIKRGVKQKKPRKTRSKGRLGALDDDEGEDLDADEEDSDDQDGDDDDLDGFIVKGGDDDEDEDDDDDDEGEDDEDDKPKYFKKGNKTKKTDKASKKEEEDSDSDLFASEEEEEEEKPVTKRSLDTTEGEGGDTGGAPQKKKVRKGVIADSDSE